MSATKISVGVNIVEKSMRGYAVISLSNTGYGNTSEPEILQGSVVEIGGSLYEFAATTETITGWASVATANIAYIELEADTSAPYPVTAKWATTAPSWNTGHHAWYNGDNRAIGFVWKASATEYEHKFFLTPRNHFEFEDHLVFEYRVGQISGAGATLTLSALSNFFENALANIDDNWYRIDGHVSDGTGDGIKSVTKSLVSNNTLDGYTNTFDIEPGSEATDIETLSIRWWWPM